MLDVVSEQIGWRPESCSQLHGRAVRSPHVMNALVGAIDLAFNQHRPLVLSPDMFWLTLLQGIGHHISKLEDPTAVGLPGGEKALYSSSCSIDCSARCSSRPSRQPLQERNPGAWSATQRRSAQ